VGAACELVETAMTIAYGLLAIAFMAGFAVGALVARR
jgi:hypothetical protein